MKQVKKKRHIFGQLFLLALMVVTFYVIFKNNPLQDILAALSEVNVWYIAAAVLVMAASILFQALALGAPFHVFGRKLSLWRQLEYALAGFFFSAVTPSSTGGQPMQIYYMCRDNLRVSHVTISMLLANLSYQITVLCFGAGMFIVKYTYVTERLNGFGALVFFGIIMNLLLMAALLFALFSKRFAPAAADKIILLLAKLHIVRDKEKTRARIQTQMEEYKGCAAAIRTTPKLFWYPFLFTFLQMLAYYSVPFFIYKAFSLTGASAFDLIALESVLFIAVSFLPLPGAVGASETGFVRLFRTFFTEQTVVPAMLLSRAVSFYLMLIVSGISVTAVQARRPDKRKKRLHLKRTGTLRFFAVTQ
ncbi:MAG: lysylphosphatidylglycerol synthase transmembrane domain-containing protein [Oscillospiraceae bacterium]|nr:lysylphosphatidylglycerol synthase transmembrane domain-containing protein [Oscillospiraceae bacterium]